VPGVTYSNIAESIDDAMMPPLCPRYEVVAIFISSNKEHGVKCL
jgi:hypothetical protein